MLIECGFLNLIKVKNMSDETDKKHLEEHYRRLGEAMSRTAETIATSPLGFKKPPAITTADHDIIRHFRTSGYTSILLHRIDDPLNPDKHPKITFG
jgi:hypothetical protein